MMTLLRRALGWIRHRRIDADVREELEFHRASVQAALERDGLSPDDARAASRRALGNVTLAREDARAVWIAPSIESVWQDARYAARTLGRERGSTLVALGALTVAIGLNTAVFSVFNAFVFRPWAVRDADRVVNIYNLSRTDLRKRAGGGPRGFSLAEVEYLGAHARTISDFVLLGRTGTARLGDRNDEARLAWVGGNYFGALGVPIAYGRGFEAGDAGPDATPVVVLSDSCWRRAFGGDTSMVGTTIRLDGLPFTVIGVTAPAFLGTGLSRTDVWLPLTAARLLRPTDPWVRNVLGKPDNCCTPLAGRLAPGVTPEQAQAELRVLRRQFHPDRAPDDAAVDLTGTTLAADPRANLSSLFLPLFTGAALVVLIACANVAHLLLARGLSRRREIGVRLSLGAGRSRIVRQLLTETLMLTAAAGALGVAIATWLPLQIIERWAAGWTALRVEPDARVAAFAIAAGACTWALCGLVPALRTTRSGIVDAMRETPPPDRPGLPVQTILLSVQIAVTVVLLVAAGALLRAVHQAERRDLGYRVRDVSVVTLEAPARVYDATRTKAVGLQLLDELDGAAPRTNAVALTSAPPLASGNIKGGYRLPDAREYEFSSVYDVSPSYFDVVQTPIVAGRGFLPSDRNRDVIVVNEALARRHWTVATAVGRHVISESPEGGWTRPGDLEIIGVAKDAHVTGLQDVDATIYQPFTGRGLPALLAPAASASEAIAAVNRIDPGLRTRAARLLENLRSQLTPSIAAAALAGATSVVALALGCIGTFAAFAYSVQQRRKEIGIRIALGATAVQVTRFVLSCGARAAAMGVAAGAAGSMLVWSGLRSYLLGLSPLDPIAYLETALVLTAAAALATFVPARRATRIDPIQALRCE